MSTKQAVKATIDRSDEASSYIRLRIDGLEQIQHEDGHNLFELRVGRLLPMPNLTALTEGLRGDGFDPLDVEFAVDQLAQTLWVRQLARVLAERASAA